MSDKKTCSVCGHRYEGNRCDRCTGRSCRQCGKPIYHDESYHQNANGIEHIRCAVAPTPRPAHMEPMSER